MFADTILIDYRADLDVLTMRWLHDHADAAEVRRCYEEVLVLARPYAAARWLIDVRRRPTPDPDVARWFGEVWLLQAAALAAPQQLRLAYLLSPLREQATFQGDPTLAPANARILANDQPYVVETFLDEGAAMRWLLIE